MAIKGTDLLLVHRDGTDYRMEATEFTVKGEKGEATTLLHFMGDVATASDLDALSSSATVGDVYRTNDTGDYWVYSDSGDWIDITDELAGTEGPKGEEGAEGEKGEPGQKGEDGAAATTAALPLENPTTVFTSFSMPDSTGLATQADFNEYIYKAVEQILADSADVEADGGNANSTPTVFYDGGNASTFT